MPTLIRPDTDTGSPDKIRWDRHEVFAALTFLEKEQAGQLAHLTRILNGYHHADRDASYYDMLCGEWLLTFAHVVYAAFLHVERDMPQSEWDHTIPVFSDYNHFVAGIVGDTRLFRKITAHVALMRSGISAQDVKFSSGSTRVSCNSTTAFRRLLRAVKKEAIGTFSKKSARFFFCRPHLNKCTRGEWISQLWKWRNWACEEDFNYEMEAGVQVDSSWREKVSQEHAGRTFAEILSAMVPLYMPAAFLEAFDSLRSQAHALKIRRPEAIYTANSLHGHTLFKILAADWRLDGTKILIHQHGGNYGLDRIHAVENYETRVSDRFYTLGWTENPAKQVVLPGAMSRKLLRTGSQPGKILLTCTTNPSNVHRIHFQPMPGTLGTMLGQTVAFVRKVKGRARLTLRALPIDYEMHTVETLLMADNSLTLDNLRISGIRSYANSDLVVHSYLGSSWLETLAMDIPTVCFYDPETYDFREQSLGLLLALKNVGILHESGEEAAKFVLSVIQHPRQWWKDPDVQDARAGFVNHYGAFSTNWPVVWENELQKWVP